MQVPVPEERCARAQVRDSLTARAKEFNILVDDIAITHLSFGTEARSLPACAPQSGCLHLRCSRGTAHGIDLWLLQQTC